MTRRIRIRFEKLGKVRFTSHRDVARVFERAIRKAGIPVVYSEGFSPRPRIRFGLALPTAYESRAEFLAIDLADDAAVEPATVVERLSDGMLPPGLRVTAADVAPAGAPSLQESVVAGTWLLEVVDLDEGAAADRVAATLAAAELPVTRERKGKTRTDDIRPAIEALAVVPSHEAADLGWGDRVVVRADLATQPRACRPRELLAAMDLAEGRVARIEQWIEAAGQRVPPLGDRPEAATLAERRAS